MKAYITFFVTIFFASFFLQAAAQGTIHDRLLGQWKGIDNRQESGALNFLDNSRIKISFVANEFLEGAYIIDTTQSPMKLDITIDNPKISRTMKGLIAFVDKNTLKWQIFLDGKRPAQFVKEEGDNTIILKRKSKN